MTITTHDTIDLLDDEGIFARSNWNGKIFNGQWVAARGGELAVTETATGATLGTVGLANAEDVLAATRRAAEVQPAWADTPVEERAAILRRAAGLLEQHRALLEAWDMREKGGTSANVGFEFQAGIGELYHAAAILTEPAGQILSPVAAGELWLARRVPIGVVGVITPWNMPLVLALRSVAPALALGNAVVLKPDLQTPILGGVVLAQVLAAAGLPEGVFHVVPGGAEAGEALVTAPEPRLITFTGSTAVGRRVGELASKHLKKVSLELGGKSPFIVLDDADLEAASSAGAFGSFFHQGQICMGSGRHIVRREIVEDYIEILTARAERLAVGDPFRTGAPIGPVINLKQVERVQQIVADSVAAGARLTTGGSHDGLFYKPTVLVDVKPGTRAYEEEIFGPVAPVIIAEDDEDAIRIANDTQYGLSGAVYTSSFERGWAIANRIHSGMIHINDQTIADFANIPMGGMGASGNGSRFGSTTNWEEFTEWQWITYRPTQIAYPF
jgi:benzaldehyde dehydrogenase (NAD)